ncbi:MAG: twin-arginine translocase subunit TatC [Bdellovibrionaceae bacterium]|nr:twin-arginine translocase subunit TatC [Pseudobdellovibrionaceae bacterium]
MAGPQDNFTLVDHLAELRTRLVYSLYAIIIFSIAAWMFSEQIFDFVRRPIQPHLPQGGLVFTAPTDKFMAHLKVSMLTGIIAACPVWIYHVWRFVEPGLYTKEKKYGIIFMFTGSFLFLSGVCFAYFLVLPTAFEVLLSFGGTTDTAMITISEYLSFFMMTTLVFGGAFEMPLVLVLLGLMGLISSSGLRKARRYAIVVIATVSALFTPPDAISMMLLAVPMCILYEISILVLSFLEPKKKSS